MSRRPAPPAPDAVSSASGSPSPGGGCPRFANNWIAVHSAYGFAYPGSAGSLATPWRTTGRQRFVATRWLGLAKIWIEERRMVYRSRNAMPPLWTEQIRWRRALRRDRAQIAREVTFDAFGADGQEMAA